MTCMDDKRRGYLQAMRRTYRFRDAIRMKSERPSPLPFGARRKHYSCLDPNNQDLGNRPCESLKERCLQIRQMLYASTSNAHILHSSCVVHLTHIYELLSPCTSNIFRYLLAQQCLHGGFDSIHGVSRPINSRCHICKPCTFAHLEN